MMKKLFQSLIVLTFMAGGATIAHAQEGPPPGQGLPQGGEGRRFQMQMPTFADLDKNKDKKITKDEFQGPPQFFDRLDENKDGVIDEEEFNRMRRGGPGGGPNMGERLSRFMDEDKDGKVTREEFAKLTQLFDALDQDKNGQLTQEEMGRFFQAMNEAQAQATGGVEVNNLFTKFDKDKDGKLTQAEMGDERTFKALDLNKDGSVTKQEAEDALKKLEAARRARQQN
ncbi:MAG TPA: EF-hand domain-containing protein [Blastocatellia bacterium]|nr:EF-hand domain-containing protein [Blastocatellia bacterium]